MDNPAVELFRPLVGRKRSHIFTEGFLKYLVAQEFFERVAFRGVQTVLAIFLLENLHFKVVAATELVHFFLIGSFISPLIGSLVSDGYTGNYAACYIFSWCELCGHLLLTTSAIPVSSWQTSAINHALLPFALFLVVLGSGALKPCQVTFGGDQMYQRSNWSVLTADEKHATSHAFFSDYYMSMNIGTLFSAVVSPVIRVKGKGNYLYTFLMPACSMALCIWSFWLGRHQYYHRPAGKLINALKSPPLLVAPDGLEDHYIQSSLLTDGEGTSKTCVKDNFWHDFKDFLYVVLRISPCPLFTAMFFQTSSTWAFQARSMEPYVSYLGGFTIQPDQMPVCVESFLVVLIIPVMDNAVYLFVEKRIMKFPNLMRMTTAILCASLSFVASGVLQSIIERDSRENETAEYDQRANLSILWQIPQYFLISLAETLMYIPAIDWSCKEVPESMKTVLQASLHVSSAVGNLITIAVVATIGSRGSKVMESFVFAGLGAVATLPMILLSYTYVAKATRSARRSRCQAS